MFSYDPAIAAFVSTPPISIAGVLATMRSIDDTCADNDGLKWFNWLYLQVTSAVEERVATEGFADPAWLAELDVQFARLYFQALRGALTGQPCPGCWRALFAARENVSIARIQFALAGINAHINHDLAEAVVATCKVRNTIPSHASVQYKDYTALNTTLDSLIASAKKTLNVSLPGDCLPSVTQLETLTAAWGTAAAREKAWLNSELLWHLQNVPALVPGFEDSLDGITTLAGKALLIPVC